MHKLLTHKVLSLLEGSPRVGERRSRVKGCGCARESARLASQAHGVVPRARPWRFSERAGKVRHLSVSDSTSYEGAMLLLRTTDWP